MARAHGREVPVGCLVDGYRGWVPVAHVDAGGLGAGLVGVVGGFAGESCCEVGEAQLVHGISDGNVGGSGWGSAVVVGGGGVYVAYDDGAPLKNKCLWLKYPLYFRKKPQHLHSHPQEAIQAYMKQCNAITEFWNRKVPNSTRFGLNQSLIS